MAAPSEECLEPSKSNNDELIPAPTPSLTKLTKSRVHHFLCSDVLRSLPGWQAAEHNADRVKVRELNGGLTNKLFVVGLEPEQKGGVGSPKKVHDVVVRFFGGGTELFFDREEENSIASFVSEHGFGARILAWFKDMGGGRIEQFLSGHTMVRSQLHRQELSALIAQRLAKFHALKPQLSSSDPIIEHNLVSWLDVLVKSYPDTTMNIVTSDSQQSVTVSQLADDVTWMNAALKETASPVLFCHNDLQEGNLIWNEELKTVTLIDFEYSNYNYRCFDLGNHMCEHFIDYSVNTFPFFTVDSQHQFPATKHRYAFYREYLSASGRSPVTESDLQDIDDETQVGMMASHLMWALWSLIQAHTSTINFGYTEYAVARYTEFQLQRKNFSKRNVKASHKTVA